MIISWERPGGGFVDELGVDAVALVDGCDWGPVRGLVDAEVLECVEKNFSDVSTVGENLTLLVSLQASFSSSSSSEL